MLKVALLAAAAALAATAATATNGAVDAAATTALPAETACHPGAPPELACPLRAAEADANAVPTDLAGLDAPAASSGILTFKDAATGTGAVLPASIDHDRPQRLAPALLALGALVLLLRRRPT